MPGERGAAPEVGRSRSRQQYMRHGTSQRPARLRKVLPKRPDAQRDPLGSLPASSGARDKISALSRTPRGKTERTHPGSSAFAIVCHARVPRRAPYRLRLGTAPRRPSAAAAGRAALILGRESSDPSREGKAGSTDDATQCAFRAAPPSPSPATRGAARPAEQKPIGQTIDPGGLRGKKRPGPPKPAPGGPRSLRGPGEGPPDRPP